MYRMSADDIYTCCLCMPRHRVLHLGGNIRLSCVPLTVQAYDALEPQPGFSRSNLCDAVKKIQTNGDVFFKKQVDTCVSLMPIIIIAGTIVIACLCFSRHRRRADYETTTILSTDYNYNKPKIGNQLAGYSGADSGDFWCGQWCGCLLVYSIAMF